MKNYKSIDYELPDLAFCFQLLEYPNSENADQPNSKMFVIIFVYKWFISICLPVLESLLLKQITCNLKIPTKNKVIKSNEIFFL